MTSIYQRDSAAASQKTTRKSDTMHSIQLLRAIAAIIVVLFHAQLAMSTHFSSPAFASESYLFAFGAVGVHIFFVISGFIMVYTTRVDRKFSSKDFFLRRILRIYPMYWLCAAFYLICHYLLGRPYQLSSYEILGALTLLPSNASAVIGPAWTLSFEMFFYLCFGFAMKFGTTRGLVILSCAFTLSIMTSFFFPVNGALSHLVTNSLLLEFIAGAFIGWLLATGRLPRRGGPTVLLFALALFAAGIAAGYDRFPSVAMWGLPSTLLVTGVVIWENARGFKEGLRPLSHFGNSSYILYLIHIIIITLTVALATHVPAIRTTEPALAAVAIAGVSLLVAEGLHTWIERPMIGWLNGLFRAPSTLRP